MSERETVKEEVVRLRRELSDLEWALAKFPDDTELANATLTRCAEIGARIDYLTREYIARGIIYEPEH